jgi:heme/copper-type cytochrome/quinol oxidase subunit 2
MWPKDSHFFFYVHALIIVIVIVIIIIIIIIILEYSNPKINKSNQKKWAHPLIYSGATIIINFLLLKVRKEKAKKK